MARIKFFKVNNSLPGAPEADAVYFVRSTISGDVTQYVTNTSGNASQVGGSGGGGSTITSTDELSEGSTNLYHTSGRVTALISAAVGVSVQAYNAGLASIAALTTTVFGRSLLTQADAAATRTTLGLGSLATQSGTFSGTSSGTNTGDQTITLSGDVTGSGTSAITATLANSGATAGSYTNANITVSAKGIVTAVANGSGGGVAVGDSPTWTGQHTFAKGTITTSTPFIETQTWNAGAVAFTAHTINVTNTASAAGSLLMDLQIGGTSYLSVRKDAYTTWKGNGISWVIDPTALGNFTLGTTGNNYLTIDWSSNFRWLSTMIVGWSSAGGSTNSTDTALSRNAAGVIEVNSGTAGTYRDIVFRSALSKSATGGVGYATGAGGAVTQITSRSTGVTLNTPTGAITLVSAAGSTTATTFTVTNSSVAATDTVQVSQKSGTDKYIVQVTAVAAGSFNVTFQTFSGTTTEQPVFNYTVIKGVTA